MKYHISTSENHCGIDLHKDQMYVCVVNSKGEILVHRNIRMNNFDYFLKIVEPYKHDMTVVCESTFNWYWLADACFGAGIEFVLAHALYLAHITHGKNKNDRIDSEKLAQLLRNGYIPFAYVYPKERRPARALLRQRMDFVWDRAKIKTQISMCQSAEGFVPIKEKGFDRDKWEAMLLDQYEHTLHKTAASSSMNIIRTYDLEIALLDKKIIDYAKNEICTDFRLLKTTDGIGDIIAMTILFEIDTISRFPTVKDYCSYCRLVKGSVSSAGKIKGLTGSKMGNPYLRWAYGQAAIHAKRHNPMIGAYAKKLTSKHGKFKANNILANKIARATYFMLQNGTVFDAERIIGRTK